METAGQAKEILQVLRTIYQRHLACDFVLAISEPDVVEFRVHRAMLAAFCGTFKKLLETGQLVTERFHLQAVDSTTMGHLIDYIYTGTLEISPSNVFAILSAASQLEMSQVTTMCQNFLMTGTATDQPMNVNIAVPVVKESSTKVTHTSGEVLLSEAASLPSTSGGDALPTQGVATAKVDEISLGINVGPVIDNYDGLAPMAGSIVIAPEEPPKKSSKRGRKPKGSRQKDKTKLLPKSKEIQGDPELVDDFDWADVDIEVASDNDDKDWRSSSKGLRRRRDTSRTKSYVEDPHTVSTKGAQKRKRGRPRRCQSTSAKKTTKPSKNQKNSALGAEFVVEYGRKRGRPRKGENRTVVRLAAKKMMYSDLKCPVCQELFVHYSAQCLHHRIHSRLRFQWMGQLQKRFMPLFVRKCFLRHSVPSVDGICQNLIAVKRENSVTDSTTNNGLENPTDADRIPVILPKDPSEDSIQLTTDDLPTATASSNPSVPVEVGSSETDSNIQTDHEGNSIEVQSEQSTVLPESSMENKEDTAVSFVNSPPQSSPYRESNHLDIQLVPSSEKIVDSVNAFNNGITMSITDFDISNIRTIIEEEQSLMAESHTSSCELNASLDHKSEEDTDIMLANVVSVGADCESSASAFKVDSETFQKPSEVVENGALVSSKIEESSGLKEIVTTSDPGVTTQNKSKPKPSKPYSLRNSVSHVRYEYECKLCHMKFPYYSQCSRHRIQKHGYIRHCRKCGKKFDHPSSMSCHKVMSHNAGLCVKTANTLTCVQCGHQFLHKQTLQQHLQRVHGSTEGSPTTPRRSLQCRHCQRAFKYTKALRIHLPYHGLTEDEINLEFVNPEKVPLRSKTFINRDQDASERLKRKCPVCAKILGNEHHLRMHMSYVHSLPVTKAYVMKMKNMGVKKWSCSEGGCSFAGLMLHELKAHMASNHPGVMYHCRVCRFKTPISKKMDRHNEQMHTLGKTCEMCGRQFRKFYHLKAHRFKAHDVTDPSLKLHKCSVQGCEYVALQRYILDIHMSKHRPEKPFQCHECGKKLKTEKNLEKHINKVHKRIRPYICDQCGASYGEESELKTHMARHDNQKKFHCEQCDYTTQEKGNFQSHMWAQHKMRIHKKQTVFQCSSCDYSTDRKTRFNQHMASHNDIRAHKCPHCDKTFVAKTTMNSHIKWAHMEKALCCDFCDHKTSTLNMLREHVRMMHTHRDVKPYKCAYCDYRCRTSGNCRKHCMNRHKDQEVRWVRVCEKYPNNSKPKLSVEAGMTENGIARKDSRTQRIFPYEQNEISVPVMLKKSPPTKPAAVSLEKEPTPDLIPNVLPPKPNVVECPGDLTGIQIQQGPLQMPMTPLQVQHSQPQMYPMPQNQPIIVQPETPSLQQLLGQQVHTLTQLTTDGISMEQPVQVIQPTHTLPPPPLLTPAISHQLPVVTAASTPVMVSGPAQLAQAQQYLLQYVQQQQQT